MSEDRKANMSEAIKALDTAFGKGTLMKMGEKQGIEVEVIPSGACQILITTLYWLPALVMNLK